MERRERSDRGERQRQPATARRFAATGARRIQAPELAGVGAVVGWSLLLLGLQSSMPREVRVAVRTYVDEFVAWRAATGKPLSHRPQRIRRRVLRSLMPVFVSPGGQLGVLLVVTADALFGWYAHAPRLAAVSAALVGAATPTTLITLHTRWLRRRKSGADPPAP